jgi:hypothetical protein
LKLVVEDHLIDKWIVKHDFVVHWTSDEIDVGSRKPLAQRSKKWHSAEHITKLVVLTNHKDILDRIEWDFGDVLAWKEQTKEGT